ncbi:MAG: type II toxin-antitoxin system RelE/ParE family toxin [Bacteroidales bacterium]|nr:type II toxin-antitoxin system RelE/ParE family toxin [Bacteroidales bacterium]
MAPLRIFWTSTAIRQRNNIFEYWNKRNRSTGYSRKLNRKIKERIEILKRNPEIGKKTNFGETRVISLGHFSIFYRKGNGLIYITGFWDNRQDPDKLLGFLRNNNE